MTRLAAFDAQAFAEAHRMVGEKVLAAMEWQMLAATGQLGSSASSAARKSISHYRTAVRANRRRLGRS